MSYTRITACIIALVAGYFQLQAATITETKDSVPETKRAFKDKKLGKFAVKIIDKVTEADSTYSVEVPYKASVEARSSIDQEVLVVNTPDGLHMKQASDLSYKLGPYLSYGPVSLGYLFTLNPTGRRKDVDVSLNINTNLFNFDFVYRRTGGNFEFRELSYPNDHGILYNVIAEKLTDSFNNQTYNTVFGFNASFLTNHKKFSNKAASSYGAIQIKSAGSPILGFGYTFQKLDFEMASAATLLGTLAIISDASEEAMEKGILSPDGKTLEEAAQDVINSSSEQEYFTKVKKLLGDFNQLIFADARKPYIQMLFNTIPSVTRIYDWHLQLGYAYNWVLSRHFMLGAQIVACPGIKRFTANNRDNMGPALASDATFKTKYLTPNGINPVMDVDMTSIGCNVNGRVSIRWYNKQWYAGATGIYNGYYYKKNDLTMNYRYWTITLCAGYNFNLDSIFKKKNKQ